MKNDSVDGFGPSSVGIGGRTRVVVAATRRSRQERERGLRIDPRDTMTITPRQTPSPFVKPLAAIPTASRTDTPVPSLPSRSQRPWFPRCTRDLTRRRSRSTRMA